jgi:hypothetical protein
MKITLSKKKAVYGLVALFLLVLSPLILIKLIDFFYEPPFYDEIIFDRIPTDEFLLVDNKKVEIIFACDDLDIESLIDRNYTTCANNKLVKDDNKFFVLDKEFGRVEIDYDEKIKDLELKEMVLVNNKPAFLAEENGIKKLFYDGEQVTTGDYEQIRQLTDLEGKIAFIGTKENGDYYIVKDALTGENEKFEFEGQPERLINVQGELAVIANEYEGGNNGNTEFVVFRGEKSNYYEEINTQLILVDDRLAYSVRKNVGYEEEGEQKCCISSFEMVQGKEEKGLEASRMITDYQAVDDKLVYTVPGKYGSKDKIVIGDEVKEYEGIYNFVVDEDQKVAFDAYDGEERFVVVDGQEKEKHDYIYSLSLVDGKIAYIAAKKEGDRIFWGGKEWETPYSNISQLIQVDGEIAFVAKDEDGKEFVVYKDQAGQKYDSVELLETEGKELAYLVEEDSGDWFIADSSGQTQKYKKEEFEFSGVEVYGGEIAYLIEEGPWENFP